MNGGGHCSFRWFGEFEDFKQGKERARFVPIPVPCRSEPRLTCPLSACDATKKGMSAQGQAHGIATAAVGTQSCQHALTLWGSRWYREGEKGAEDCGLAVSLKQKGNKGRKGVSRKRESELLTLVFLTPGGHVHPRTWGL